MLRLVQQPGKTHTCSKCKQKKERLIIDEENTLMCIECSELPVSTCAHIVTKADITGKDSVYVSNIVWDPQFNRGYCTSLCPTRNADHKHTHWHMPIARPLVPYYVPSGWCRLSFKVQEEELPDWDSKHWQHLYHGTHPNIVHLIKNNGFKVKQCQHGFPAVYLTPSITYAAHPRYSRVIFMRRHNAFFQFVVEARVDTRRLQPVLKRETLSVADKGTIDRDYPKNENIEYLLQAPAGEEFLTAKDGVVISGIMVRRLPFDPAALPESWWWPLWSNMDKLHAAYYYDGSERGAAHALADPTAPDPVAAAAPPAKK